MSSTKNLLTSLSVSRGVEDVCVPVTWSDFPCLEMLSVWLWSLSKSSEARPSLALLVEGPRFVHVRMSAEVLHARMRCPLREHGKRVGVEYLKLEVQLLKRGSSSVEVGDDGVVEAAL